MSSRNKGILAIGFALVAPLLMADAAAQKLFQPPGANLTYGDVTHGMRVQSASTNPAAAAAEGSGLSEETGRQLMANSEDGVCILRDGLVINANRNLDSYRAFGYPVVVKGLGAALAHKTERGLVHLNLNTSQAVEKAVEAITASAGDDLEGFVIQPQIQGKRELVAGLFRDPQFGPVVMFGIGGVLALRVLRRAWWSQAWWPVRSSWRQPRWAHRLRRRRPGRSRRRPGRLR